MADQAGSSVSRLSISGAIGYGWRRTWRNFWWFALVIILFSVINGLASSFSLAGEFSGVDWSNPNTDEVLSQLSESSSSAWSVIGAIVQFLVSIFLSLGLVRIALAVTTGDRVRIDRLFAFNGFGRYLVGSIVIAVIVTIGFGLPTALGLWLTDATGVDALVFLGAAIGVVLAIVLSLGLSMYGYVIVDRDASGLSALSTSWQIVRPQFGSLLGLQIVLVLVGFAIMVVAILLGILLIVVGLLITLPVAGVIVFGLSSLSLAFAYRALSGQSAV